MGSNAGSRIRALAMSALLVLAAAAMAACGRDAGDGVGGGVTDGTRPLLWDDPLTREEGTGNLVTNCDHPKLTESLTGAYMAEEPLDECPVIRVCMNMSDRGFLQPDGSWYFSVDPRAQYHPDFRGTIEIQFPRAQLWGSEYMEYYVSIWDGFGHPIKEGTYSVDLWSGDNRVCLRHRDADGSFYCLDDAGSVVYTNCRPSQPDFNLIEYSNPPAIVEVVEYSQVLDHMEPRARGITYLVREGGKEALPPPATVEARWDPSVGFPGGLRVEWSAVEGAERYAVIATGYRPRYLFTDIGLLLGSTWWAYEGTPFLPEDVFFTGTEGTITDLGDAFLADWEYDGWVYVAAVGPGPESRRGMPSRAIHVTSTEAVRTDGEGTVLGPVPRLAACGPDLVPPGLVACCAGTDLGTIPGRVWANGQMIDPGMIHSWTDDMVCFRYPWDPWNDGGLVSVETPAGWATPVELYSSWADIKVFEVVPDHGRAGDEIMVYGQDLWPAYWSFAIGNADSAVALEEVERDTVGNAWFRLRIPSPLPADAPPLREDLRLTIDATTRWSAGHQFVLHDADVADEVLAVYQATTDAAAYSGWISGAADLLGGGAGTPAFGFSEHAIPRIGWDGPPRRLMGEFEIVFWTAGALPFSQITGRDVVGMDALLEGGGALWIEGGRIASWIEGTDLAREMLHADLSGAVSCDPGTALSVAAPAGSPLAASIAAPVPLACAAAGGPGTTEIETLAAWTGGEVLLALEPGGEAVAVGYGGSVVFSTVPLSDLDVAADPAAPAKMAAAILGYLGAI